MAQTFRNFYPPFPVFWTHVCILGIFIYLFNWLGCYVELKEFRTPDGVQYYFGKKIGQSIDAIHGHLQVAAGPAPRMSRHILLLSDMIYSVLQRSSSIKTDRLQRFAKNTLSITITFVTTESLIREKKPTPWGLQIVAFGNEATQRTNEKA